MVTLNYLGISSFEDDDARPAISDILWVPDTDIIYTSSGAYGWVSSWDWDGGSMDHTGEAALLQDHASSGSAQLALVPDEDAYFISVAGGAVDGVDVYQTQNTAIGDLSSFGGDLGELTNLAWIQGEGATTLVATDEAGAALSLWTLDAGGDAQRLDDAFVTDVGGVATISGVVHFMQGDTAFVAAIDQTGNTVTLLEVTDDGFGTSVQLGNQDGLPIARPTQIEAVEVDGQTLLIVAGAGSNSISVIAVEDGSMELRDQVIDDRNTRFEGVGVLETIVFQGQAYIAASGQDSGLTLFTVLPDGKLLSVATLEDQIVNPLEDITAMEFAVQDGALHLLVAGEGWEGLSVLEVDTGVMGSVRTAADGGGALFGGGNNNIMMGAAGDDRVFGGDGDDILMDGAGSDELTGGEGSDVFVFEADGEADVITDFNIAEDKINLSFWGRIYDAGSLDFEPIDGGVEITFEDELLKVLSHDGQELSEEQFSNALLLDMTHVAVNSVPEISVPADDDPPIEDEEPVVEEDDPSVEDDDPSAEGDDPPVVDEPTAEDDGPEFDLSGGNFVTGTSGKDVLVPESLNPAFDAAAGVVTRLFQAVLAREPGMEGHANWTAQLLDQSLDGEGLASALMSSAEFQFIYGDTGDEDFINLLFENVLGRPAAAAGLAAWVGQLEDGMSRASVVQSFSGTPEFTGMMLETSLGFSFAAHQAEWMDDVFRLFQTTLGRAPAEGGMLWWSENLANGATFLSAIKGFVNGPEFQENYGDATNLEFASLLFQNVLGRAPAQDGLNYWVDQLDAGMDRAEVVAFFAQSVEFTKTSQPDFVNYMRKLSPDDVISGQGGDDVLQGGGLSDVFVFDTTSMGDSVIVDFEVWDTLMFTNSDFATENDVLDALQQQGDNVVIENGNGSVTLLDTTVDEFSTDNFSI